MKTLKEYLQNWNDFDGAMYYLGLSLGIFKQEQTFPELKDIFWTNNLVGNTLNEILENLVSAGILIENEDGQYKWNNNQKEY